MNRFFNKIEERAEGWLKSIMIPAQWKENLALGIIFMVGTMIFGALVMALISIVKAGLWWFPVIFVLTCLAIWAIKYLDQ